MPTIWIKPQSYLNQDVDKFNISDLETFDSVNVTSPQKGRIDVCKGYSQVGATYDSGNGNQGYGVYRKSDGTQQHHVMVNGVLKKSTGGNFTNIATGLNTSDQFSFVNHLNRNYFVSPNSLIAYTDGSTRTAIPNVKAKYLAVLNDILIAANITDTILGSGSVLPNYFVYSQSGTHVFYESSETYATTTRKGFIDGSITAVKVYGGRVLMWTDYDMWEVNFNDFTAERIGNTGCSSHWSVAEAQKGTLVWSDSKTIWAWGGAGDPVDIGMFIQLDLSAVTNSRDIRIESIYPNLYVYLGESVNGYTNNLQVFNFTNRSWERRNNHPVGYFGKYVSSGIKELYFADHSAGKMFKMEDGATLAGSAIGSVFKTKHLDFGTPEKKSFNKIHIKYVPSDEVMTVDWSLDARDYTGGKQITLDASDQERPQGRATKTVSIESAGVQAETISLKLTNVHNVLAIGFELETAANLYANAVEV